MNRFILCHYHEIALKGKNRVFFESLLCNNVQKALRGLPYQSVRKLFGRAVVHLAEDSPVDEIVRRLGEVFGIASYSPAWACAADLETIKAALRSLIEKREFGSFKIHARRADKKFPLRSPELNIALGSFVQERSGARVRMDEPDLTCFVHLVDDRAFLYFDRFRGAGGLPVSSAGKVVVLLSGGIDSPVASYKMLRRGCRVIFVHFHSYPHTTTESQDKVREMVRRLNRFQYRSKLYLLPFAETQREVVASTPPRLRVILYRRLMMRLAERVATRERAKALVTGDSIGQVASQTLENISVISRAARLPILRPLIGEDKEEIIAQARTIGTYDVSIRPDQDCCSLFIPRNPETRAQHREVEEAEGNLDIAAILKSVRKQAVTETFDWRPHFEVATERVPVDIGSTAD